jgi:hypothetical protein
MLSAYNDDQWNKSKGKVVPVLNWIKHHAMKTYRAVEVHLNIFLTSELVGGAGPTELSHRIEPPVLIGCEAGSAPEAEWMLRRKGKSLALARN